MQVTVLGSASPYARPGNACSGYLVRRGTTALWMEAGSGTLAELQRYVRIDELGAIWISHLHADHSADLLTAFYALVYADLAPSGPIPLYGPPGTAARLQDFLSNKERSPVERAFDVRELYDGHETRVGGLTLRSRLVQHGFPAFGVRIADGAASLAFSGDTAPCEGLDAVAEGAGTLLCEADSGTASAEDPPVHHTPEEAGRAAARAGSERLIVTHVGPSLTPGYAVQRAAAEFGGPVEYAAPGRTFTLA